MSAVAGVFGCLVLVLAPLAFIAGIVYLIVWWTRRNRSDRFGRPVSGGTLAMMIALGVGAVLGVILFIGLISALLIPNFVDALGKARQKRTLADLRAVSQVLEQYRAREGSYPSAGDAGELLDALAAAGFVEGFTTTDAWKHPLSYRCWNPVELDGLCTDYRLASPGADGAFDGGGSTGEDSGGPYDLDLVIGPDGILQGPPAR